MNLIDKDALIEALGIETDCYDCEHERLKYHCDLDPVEACTKIVEAPVVTVTTESAEKAIEVLKNAILLGSVYPFKEIEEAVKTAIRALQGDHFAEVSKKGDMISRADAVDAISKIKRTDNWQAAVSMALMDLPSAQPNVQDSVKDADCISRQQAIDTAVTFARRALLDSKPIDVKMSSDYIFVNIVEPMRKLPSAQQELPIKEKCTVCPHCDNCDVNDDGTIAQSEIIKCKDCKHWERTWTNYWPQNYHYCPMIDRFCPSDFYCADAEERRTDE